MTTAISLSVGDNLSRVPRLCAKKCNSENSDNILLTLQVIDRCYYWSILSSPNEFIRDRQWASVRCQTMIRTTRDEAICRNTIGNVSQT